MNQAIEEKIERFLRRWNEIHDSVKKIKNDFTTIREWFLSREEE